MTAQDFNARVDAAMASVFDGLVTGGLKEMRSRIFLHLSSLNQERTAEIARLGGELSRFGTRFEEQRAKARRRRRLPHVRDKRC